jgi:hypothetical protein
MSVEFGFDNQFDLFSTCQKENNLVLENDFYADWNDFTQLNTNWTFDTEPDNPIIDDRRKKGEENRRQIHIQSEQKRRTQIKNGFEALRAFLPATGKKISKKNLLTRSIRQLRHMNNIQQELLLEIERLSKENLALKASCL